jgi:spore germination protein GerM
MEALLAGPTDDESAANIFTAIPDGARLLGLEVVQGIATVDLSREFEPSSGTTGELLTLAQVVYTLTQFPTVDAVRFELEGKEPRLFASHGFMLQGNLQTRKDYRWLRHPVR